LMTWVPQVLRQRRLRISGVADIDEHDRLADSCGNRPCEPRNVVTSDTLAPKHVLVLVAERPDGRDSHESISTIVPPSGVLWAADDSAARTSACGTFGRNPAMTASVCRSNSAGPRCGPGGFWPFVANVAVQRGGRAGGPSSLMTWIGWLLTAASWISVRICAGIVGSGLLARAPMTSVSGSRPLMGQDIDRFWCESLVVVASGQ